MRSKYEIRCQKELEAEGYRVDYKIRPSRLFRGQQIDFFGLFDIVAAKRGEKLRWISIKGHQGVPTKHIRDITEFWLPEGCTKEVWQWPNNKKKKECIKKIYESA